MYQLLPDYIKMHELGKQRKKNPHKMPWLLARLAEYKVRYPGRVETWEFKGLPENASPVDREKRYLQVRLAE